MDFEPTEGKYLAYPNNREIIVLDCDSWSQRMQFTQNTVSNHFIYQINLSQYSQHGIG